MTIVLETDEVGQAVDRVCGNTRRDIRKVAGRLIEEVAELAAECGVTPAEMRGHLEDSIHNMCLKQAHLNGRTVFPSQLQVTYDAQGVLAEAGDSLLLLKDVLYLAGHSQASAEKYAAIKYLQVRNQPSTFTTFNGSTFYKIKDHVK